MVRRGVGSENFVGVIEAKESNLRISLEYRIRVLITDWTTGTGPFSRGSTRGLTVDLQKVKT